MLALSDFEGRWHLARRVEDHRAGLTGRLDGTATWSRRDPATLEQTETGLLHYGSAPPMQATRRYLWRADGQGIAVFFDDGRPFHSFRPQIPTARHHCPPDLYDVTYDLSGWPRWTATWQVTGPRKHATIVSRYSPAP